MRRKIVVLILIALAIGASLFTFMMYKSHASVKQMSSLKLGNTEITRSKAIILENTQHGTTRWRIPGRDEATVQIQAYASATSIFPGQRLTFYASTQTNNAVYSIEIYRLGWYGGTGGRLMTSIKSQIGHQQGYYNPNSHQLIDCTSCTVDVSTGLVDAHWHPSYTLTIPSNWMTGVYLAKFIDANNLQTYVPFDVKGPTTSYIAVTADTTYQAYNDWGEYSLYMAYNPAGIGSIGRGVKVSFNRPYTEADGYGSAQVLVMEAPAIHWMEREGYSVSYMSDVDLHANPAQILHYRAYLSLGHDEYWTKEMRDGVESARNHGVGLAFFEGNEVYWQMRFEPDSAGTPNRTIVCYKVETSHKDLSNDPLYGKDNSRVTTLWRDPLLARPENALAGIMFSSDVHRVRGYPWRVNPEANSSLLEGTGLQQGQMYGCGVVGYEWDRIYNNGATPPGLQVLSVSHTVDLTNKSDVSNTTYYIASSGAMVFATGSIFWTTALDEYRLYTDPSCSGQKHVVPGMQKLMEHVMDALVVNQH